MRIIPLSEVLEMSDGETLVAISGKIADVYKANKGTNSKGDYSLQNVTLEQAGTKIRLLLSNHDTEIPNSWKGKKITIEAHKNDKGKWTGLYVFDDTYKVDKGEAKTPERRIKVTSTAIISEDGVNEERGGGSPEDQEPHRPARQPQREQADFKQEAQRPASESHHRPSGMAEIVKAADQIATLQLVAICAVESYVRPYIKAKTGLDLDAAGAHAWAMNIAIQLERTNSHTQMPTQRLPIPSTAKPAGEQRPVEKSEPERDPKMPDTYKWDGKTGQFINPDTGDIWF